MEFVHINGVTLEVEVQGSGEPVVLVHGNILADGLAPLMEEPILTQHYRMVRYHRCGFAGSTHLDPPVSIAQQAEHCRALMRHLNIERAHIVGHSYGGPIALQLALDAPDAVHSLSLLEPPLLGAIPSDQKFMERMELVQQIYKEGKRSEAIDTFLRLVCGQEYRRVIDQALPGGYFEQAVADLDTFFQIELPALQEWSFTREAAERVKQPVLSVLGADSAPMFREVHKVVLEWLPQAEELVLPNATHLLQMMNPRDMAAGLVDFFIRHQLPLPVSDLFEGEMADLKDEVRTIMDNADAWLNTPNDQFAGKRPIDLIGGPEEYRLRNLIRAVKHGMVS